MALNGFRWRSETPTLTHVAQMLQVVATDSQTARGRQ